MAESDVCFSLEISELDLPSIERFGFTLVPEECTKEENGAISLMCIPAVKAGEPRINSRKLLQNLMVSESLPGMRSLKALLRNQHLIPADWQTGKRILFLGAVIRREHKGYIYVACLEWYCEWCLDVFPMSTEFDTDDYYVQYAPSDQREAIDSCTSALQSV